MKILIAIAAVLAFLAIVKFLRFMLAGGSLTQPARNATFMYRQVRIVYDKLPENQARFMALFLNSFAARSEMPESLIRMLVLDNEGKSWEDLCLSYTWLWAKRVGHVDVDRLSLALHLSLSQKIRDQIQFANFAVDRGDRRSEPMLRSIPQYQVMLIVAQAEESAP